MKEKKSVISLEIYDEVIDVNVCKSDTQKYVDAAKFVNDRLEAYTRMYRERKSHHTISLMTMLDIAVKLWPDSSYKVKRRSLWDRIKDYIASLRPKNAEEESDNQ